MNAFDKLAQSHWQSPLSSTQSSSKPSSSESPLMGSNLATTPPSSQTFPIPRNVEVENAEVSTREPSVESTFKGCFRNIEMHYDSLVSKLVPLYTEQQKAIEALHQKVFQLELKNKRLENENEECCKRYCERIIRTKKILLESNEVQKDVGKDVEYLLNILSDAGNILQKISSHLFENEELIDEFAVWNEDEI